MVVPVGRESTISEVEVIFTRLRARPSVRLDTPTCEMPSSIREQALRLALRIDACGDDEPPPPRRDVYESEIEITERMIVVEATAPLPPATREAALAIAATMRTRRTTDPLYAVAPPPPRPAGYAMQPYPTPVPPYFDPRATERPSVRPSAPPCALLCPSSPPPASPSVAGAVLVTFAFAATFVGAAAAALLYFA